MADDLDARIRERLAKRPSVFPGMSDDLREYHRQRFDEMAAAILSVLAKHPHIRATDESDRHVDTLGQPYDFGCGTCHTWRRGSSSLDGRGWCETVTDIAKALGIEVDGG